MPSYNKVMLMGSLTRDPEIKYLPSGKAIAQFGMAMNRNYTTDSGEKREEVTFVDVECFGRVAELVGEYCKKGKAVFTEGRLKLDSWDDKSTGQKRNKLKVVADSVQFLGGKDSGEQSSGSRPAGKPSGLPQRPPQRPQADPDLDAAPDDDIPF